jgi:D-alanyl-D-alanine carboxypeptidase
MAANGLLNTSKLTYVGGGQRLRSDAALRWFALVAACFIATGVRLGATEAYRSLTEQDRLFRARYTSGWSSGIGYDGKYWRKKAGVAAAAVPGTSNHGWAIAVDMNNYSNARVWQWLLDHAPGFGFSWAEGKADGEPWHWVYVGGGSVPATTNTPTAAEEDDGMKTSDLIEVQGDNGEMVKVYYGAFLNHMFVHINKINNQTTDIPRIVRDTPFAYGVGADPDQLVTNGILATHTREILGQTANAITALNGQVSLLTKTLETVLALKGVDSAPVLKALDAATARLVKEINEVPLEVRTAIIKP